jgi:DNA-binding beta-propeller fold protein YncE
LEKKRRPRWLLITLVLASAVAVVFLVRWTLQISQDERPTEPRETRPPIVIERTPVEPWRPVGSEPLRFSVGHQPKQVAFTPDGRDLVVPLLGAEGIDLISLETGEIRRTAPGPDAGWGYAEVLIDPVGGTFLVSQMTTGKIHEFDLQGNYQRSFSTGGTWSKVIAMTPDRAHLAVSNWLSDNVTVLTRDGEIERRVSAPGARVPRGVAFTDGGAEMLVTWYETGELTRHRVSDGSLLARYKRGGALRHVVLDAERGVAYVSNMHYEEVLAIDVASFTVLGSVSVDYNPNTIVLSEDGSTLYVSCRGPNNPESYLLRSPRPGTIHIVRTRDMTTRQVLSGGTQPTGLALSPDERLLASTSFQDDEVLVWSLHNGLVVFIPPEVEP